ncbi:MAG: glycosyltransferase family 2 protein [Nodosilinea sp.]
MLAFIIPLKSSQVSGSWDLVCKLFERTLRSVCSQTSLSFHVIVVCHERPKISFHSPQVTYLQVDFPLPGAEYVSKERDRRLKVQVGLIHAKKLSASHVMFVDADDCVSNRLAKFVSENSKQNGWFLNRGYDYREDIQLLRIRNKNLHLRTGSSHIIRLNLLEPEVLLPPDQLKISNCVLNHVDTVRILKKRGSPLKPLPFKGVIYVTDNGENIWWNQESRRKKNSLKETSINIFKDLYQSFIARPVTESIRDEFGLYSIDIKRI